MKTRWIQVGLLLLAIGSAQAAPIIDYFVYPQSQHNIGGSSVGFGGYVYWNGLSGEDVDLGNGIRFRGVTCLDGRGPECGGLLAGNQLSEPITMRLTEFAFSCDNTVDGCPAFEATLVAEFVLEAAPLSPFLITSYRIEGCTLNEPVGQGGIGSCEDPGGYPISIGWHFAFTTSTEDGNDSVTVEYGDSSFQSPTGVSGQFDISGGSLLIPSNRRMMLAQRFKIGGPLFIDDQGQRQYGNWYGAIHFPGSISGSLDPLNQTNPTPIPEPRAGWLLTSGFVLVVFGGRHVKTVKLAANDRRRNRVAGPLAEGG
jgi:hypothetical protein